MTSPADLRGRRVLITGGLGFIGSGLAVACVRQGASVTLYDSLDPRCGGNPANVADVAADVRIVRGDIRDADRVAAVAAEHEILFNCAALTSHRGSLAEPRDYVAVNCGAVIPILEGLARAPSAIRFVQVGTSTQIGRMLRTPVTEDHPESPLDLYSATKAAAEKIVLSFGAGHGLATTVIRLGNVYGPRARITDPGLGFVNYFIGLALQDRELPVYGDGAQLRTITFVEDAVAALLGAATSEACRGRVLFAVSEERHRVREIAERIVAAFGAGRVVSVEWPRERAAIEVGDAVISSARIREALGWEAATPIDAGLALTRAYYEPRRAAYLG